MQSVAFDTARYTNTPFSMVVPKPWGHEVIFAPPDKGYCGKLLYVRAGCRLSLQYHDLKEETILLLRGKATLLSDNARGELEAIDMVVGHGYSNVPGQRHRLIAMTDCEFVEASSPEVGTTYRLEDDAGRAHETDTDRHRARRQAAEVTGHISSNRTEEAAFFRVARQRGVTS